MNPTVMAGYQAIFNDDPLSEWDQDHVQNLIIEVLTNVALQITTFDWQDKVDELLDKFIKESSQTLKAIGEGDDADDADDNDQADDNADQGDNNDNAN
jgi:hypothetical protein